MMLLSTAWAMAQSGMTDQQLITFILEENEKGSTQTEIVTKLMQRGVDMQQLQRVKRKYDRQLKQTGMGSVADDAISKAEDRMRKNNGQQRSTITRPTGQGSNMVRQIPQGQQTYDEDDPLFMQMQAELGYFPHWCMGYDGNCGFLVQMTPFAG